MSDEEDFQRGTFDKDMNIDVDHRQSNLTSNNVQVGNIT